MTKTEDKINIPIITKQESKIYTVYEFHSSIYCISKLQPALGGLDVIMTESDDWFHVM